MRLNVEKLLSENNLEALKQLTYYDLFNINKYLNTEDLKKQVSAKYHALALRFHPDRTQGDFLKSEIFKFIQAAYEILMNDNTRASYNISISDLVKNRTSFFDIDRLMNNEAFFRACGSNFPERTSAEFDKSMSEKIAERKAREAITERVVKAFVIIGGNYNEREIAIESLKMQHIGSTEIGMRCIGSDIKEPVKTTFPNSLFACYTSTHHRGDNLKESYSTLLLSNHEVLTCHQDDAFIKRLAETQKNVTTLTVESRCCVM